MPFWCIIIERPITFLYNTFNFYERDLKERVSLKKKMLHEVMKGFKDIRPANWVLSEPFTEYLQSNELLFNPEMPYYIGLVRRLADGECNCLLDNYRSSFKITKFPSHLFSHHWEKLFLRY